MFLRFRFLLLIGWVMIFASYFAQQGDSSWRAWWYRKHPDLEGRLLSLLCRSAFDVLPMMSRGRLACGGA